MRADMYHCQTDTCSMLIVAVKPNGIRVWTLPVQLHRFISWPCHVLAV